MDAFRITTIHCRGLITQNTGVARFQDGSEGIVDRQIRGRERWARFVNYRQGIERELKSAIDATVDGRPDLPELAQCQCKLVQHGGVAAPEVDLDFAEARRLTLG